MGTLLELPVILAATAASLDMEITTTQGYTDLGDTTAIRAAVVCAQGPQAAMDVIVIVTAVTDVGVTAAGVEAMMAELSWFYLSYWRFL